MPGINSVNLVLTTPTLAWALVINPILQMGCLRHSEVKSPVQGDAAGGLW